MAASIAAEMKVELEDGSHFYIHPTTNQIRCEWKNMHVHLLIGYDNLCRAGWDQTQFPSLDLTVPVDAVEAVRIFLGDKVPDFYDPHICTRFPKLLQFIRSWGCHQTSWLNSPVAIESVQHVLKSLPINPEYLIPRVRTALEKARYQSVMIKNLDEFVMQQVQEGLRRDVMYEMADMIKLTDVGLTLEFIAFNDSE